MKLDRFTCYVDTRRLFQPITHTISPGDCVEVIGANGSGKTSLLHALADLRAYQGSLQWHYNQAERQTQYHLLAHEHGLYDELSPQESWDCYAKWLGMNPIPNTHDLLARWQMKAHQHQPNKTLSYGQHKKVQWLKMLYFPKPLWLLDEPFNGLDKTCLHLCLEACEQHLKKGGMIIFSAHGTHPLKTNITTHWTLSP